MATGEGATTTQSEQPRVKSSRRSGRGTAAWVILIIAGLMFPIALTAFWAQRTLVDTERFVATVAPLSQDPTVREAVATSVTATVVKQLDLEANISSVLSATPRLQPLAGAISVAVENFVREQIDRVLASDQFSSLWIGINTRAQQALIAAPSGELTGPVTIRGEQVVLDTGDLIAVVKTRLVERGPRFIAIAPIPPQIDREIVLLNSPQLQRAQTVYAIGQPVAAWLIYVVLAMFLGAVLLSEHRARMVIATGVAIMLGALALKLGLAIGESQFELVTQNTPFALAEQAFFTTLTYFLVGSVRAAFAVGVLLALLGWYFSETAGAAMRGTLSDRMSVAGAKAADGPLGNVGWWVLRARTALRIVIVAIAVGVLVTADRRTTSVAIGTVALAALAVAIIEVLAAAGTANQEDSDSAVTASVPPTA